MADGADRVAIVTGAGRGVGEAVVGRLCGAGWRVVAVDLDGAAAERVAASQPPNRAVGVAADVRDRAQVGAAVDVAVGRLGRIDAVVNNAGVWTVSPFADSDPAAWERDIAVNLVGPLHLVHLALPHLLERGWGRVVSIVSDAGRVGEPNIAVYAAAKAAVGGFSRSLAKEVGRRGVTVNCVSLSTTLTPGAAATFTEEQLAKMPRAYPVGRLGRPEDAAGAVAYFLSEEAAWVTGQTLGVNGGFAML